MNRAEKEEKFIVCDVAISWEGHNNLNHSFSKDTSTYGSESFIMKVKEKLPNKNIYVSPLIMYTRSCIQLKRITTSRIFTSSTSDSFKLSGPAEFDENYLIAHLISSIDIGNEKGY